MSFKKHSGFCTVNNIKLFYLIPIELEIVVKISDLKFQTSVVKGSELYTYRTKAA